MANNIMAYHVTGNVHEKFAGKKVCTKMTSRIFNFLYIPICHIELFSYSFDFNVPDRDQSL